MKTLIAIIKKEFLQLLRSPSLMAIIIICPIIITGIIPFAIGNKIKITADIIDNDHSNLSQNIIMKLNASEYFVRIDFQSNIKNALNNLKNTNTDMFVVVPKDYESSQLSIKPKQLYVALDATHTLNAQYCLFYLKKDLLQNQPSSKASINVKKMFYVKNNGRLNYISSLIILMLTLVSMSLITLNVVTERENKILDHLLSTNMNRKAYITAKMLFFSMIALFELAVGLIIGYLVFDLRVSASIIELFITILFLINPLLGIGMFISILSKSKIRAIYVLIFILLILILLSTMFAPLDSMSPISGITRFVNPIFWMVNDSSKIIIKGASFNKMLPEIGISFLAGIIISGINLKLINNKYHG